MLADYETLTVSSLTTQMIITFLTAKHLSTTSIDLEIIVHIVKNLISIY